MAKKKKTYIACITKNGIAEALYKDWLEASPNRQIDWEKEMIRSHLGCKFEELTEAQVNKGIDQYGKFLEREEKKKIKERKELYKKLDKDHIVVDEKTVDKEKEKTKEKPATKEKKAPPKKKAAKKKVAKKPAKKKAS